MKKQVSESMNKFIESFFETRYQIPLRGICARARTRSLALLEPCPLVLRDGLSK